MGFEIMCIFLVAVFVVTAGALGEKLPVVINTWPFVDANIEGKSDPSWSVTGHAYARC